MSSPATPDEPSPSSTRPAAAKDSDPPPTDPQRVQVCPRCGGEALPRGRRPNRLNPFLAKSAGKVQLTCVDCGLEVEAAADSGPWNKST